MPYVTCFLRSNTSPLKCFRGISGIIYLFAFCKAGSCCVLFLQDFHLNTQGISHHSVPCTVSGHCPTEGENKKFSCPKTLSHLNQPSAQSTGKTCFVIYFIIITRNMRHDMSVYQCTPSGKLLSATGSVLISQESCTKKVGL